MLFPVEPVLENAVMGGNRSKGYWSKADLKSFAAHHKFLRRKALFRTRSKISHYKWNDRALDRPRWRGTYVPWQQSWDFDAEFQRVLNHDELHGRFAHGKRLAAKLSEGRAASATPSPGSRRSG